MGWYKMKINELITRLQAIEKEHGNVEMYVLDREVACIDKDIEMRKGCGDDYLYNGHEISTENHWVIS